MGCSFVCQFCADLCNMDHHHFFICPVIQQYAHLHEYNSRRAGQQGPIWTLTAALKRSIKTVTGCIYIHHQTPASAHRSSLCRTASSNWANSVRPRCVIIARLSGSQSPVSRFMSDRPKHSPDPQWLFLFLCLGAQGNGVLAPLGSGKSGPALGGTEYRLMPSACRLIVRAKLWNLLFRYLVSRAPMRRRGIVVV